MSKKLRFAALIRVSTEKQEKQGESLSTQKKDNIDSVNSLCGEIVGWYGGQEHGTPGYEKKEVNRLISDAERNRFDAVIVAHADRWSRDNDKSSEGLEVFRQHHTRFFVGETEFDLFDPEQCMFLDMSAVIGKFLARNQAKKSLRNRITRARRGLPTAGNLPFGRIWNPKTEKWKIDPDKRRMIQDVAKRYLAGEWLADLATEVGLSHPYLHLVLMERTGPIWRQSFQSKALNIREIVDTPIPPLLDDETIRLCRERAKRNKTRRNWNNRYLLQGKVFCGHCGYALTPQSHKLSGFLYYRHGLKYAAQNCDRRPRPYVRADQLEHAVLHHILDFYGNPNGVKKAIEDATPNAAKIKEVQARIRALDAENARLDKGRDQILKLILSGRLTQPQAEKRLDEAAAREQCIEQERSRLIAAIDDLPTPEKISEAAKQFTARYSELNRYSDTKLIAKMRAAQILESMTWEQKQALLNDVFDGETLEGKPMGVYVFQIDGQQAHLQKQWRFRLIGNAAINGHYDRTESVMKSASYSPS